MHCQAWLSLHKHPNVPIVEILLGPVLVKLLNDLGLHQSHTQIVFLAIFTSRWWWCVCVCVCVCLCVCVCVCVCVCLCVCVCVCVCVNKDAKMAKRSYMTPEAGNTKGEVSLYR
jgi:hypothetical protein